MSRLLTKEGFGVVLACDGTEGLARAREVRPAVITLDVVMPGVDGWARWPHSRAIQTFRTSRW